MKITTSEQWLSLAVSKDESRTNLTGVYRDKDALVATDGHRLHMKKMPESQIVGYLDGRTDTVFPSYKQVLPNETGHRVEVINPLEQIEKLKLVSKVPSDRNKLAKIRFESDKDYLEVLADDGFRETNITTKIRLSEPYKGPTLTIGVNVNYLIDALSVSAPNGNKRTGSPSVYMSVTSEVAPIKFDYAECSAIVMPMRLN